MASSAYAANPYQNELSLIASGHPSQAYNRLRPKLLGSAGNPDFDTAFGLAALDSGATTEAVTALERVLALDPANLPVRTELARAYAQLGDTTAAKRELDTVKDQPQTPPEVRTNLSRYTTVLDEALSGGPATLNATLDVTTGYDSNINTATTADQLLVPALAALGPARLSGGAQAEGTAFTEADATLTWRKPLTISSALFISVGGSQKSGWDTSDYNQTTLNTETGLQVLTPHGDRFTVGLSAQQFWFGGDDYSFTTAANGSWQHPLSPDTTLTTYATVGHIDYQTTQPSANRAILGTTLGSRLTHTFSPYLFAGVYGGAEESEGTAADHFSHTLVGVHTGIELFPAPQWSLFADARYEYRDFDAPFPLFLTNRQDKQLDLSIGTSYALSPRLALRPTLSFRNASSNIGFYDYSRWLAALNLRYAL